MIKTFIATIALSIASFAALAGPFEDLPHNVTLTASYAPGGAADSQIRHLQEYFASRGITIVVSYKPGANGVVSMQAVPRLPKDGSNIIFTAAGFIANSEAFMKESVVDPLTITGITMSAFIVNPNGKYSTLEKFEEAVKNNDKDLDIGYHSIGSIHVFNNYFSRLGAGAGPLRIMYKSPVDSSLNVISGVIDAAIVPMSVAEPLAKTGQVKIISAVGPRSLEVPNGVVSLSKRWPNWKHADGFMLAAPVGMSKESTTNWLGALQEYYKDPKTKEFYERQHFGLEPFGPETANALVTFAKQEFDKLPVAK